MLDLCFLFVVCFSGDSLWLLTTTRVAEMRLARRILSLSEACYCRQGHAAFTKASWRLLFVKNSYK